MSRPRGPDPTLDALDRNEPLQLDHAKDLPVAHLPGSGESPACGHSIGQYDGMWIIAEFARWFAVPCRDCFQDAPEPGYAVSGFTGRPVPLRGLAWQVTT